MKYQTIKRLFLNGLLCTTLAITQMGADCDGNQQNAAPTNESTRCTSNQAQIRILDGLSQRLCGCNETSTQMIKPPSTLTCTINRGTRVFVHFVGAANFHQLQSINTPSFPSSGVYNPDDTNSQASFVIHFTNAGTYEFRDAFDHAISGSFVVL